MRFGWSLALLVGLMALPVGSADAQVFSRGGVPPSTSYPGYAPGYSSPGWVAAPGMVGGSAGYSSGYAGLPRTNPTGYQNRPYYGAYGYGFYSNGSTDGFPPFRPATRFRRSR